MARPKKTVQPVVEPIPQGGNWLDALFEYPIINGAAIAVVGIFVVSLLFNIVGWLGFFGLIAFSVVDGIAIRFAINSFQEELEEELKLFTSFAIVTTIWVIWTFAGGFTTAYGITFGIIALLVAICYIVVAWLQFREQETRKGVIAVCVCVLTTVFAFLSLPFDLGNSRNSVTKTESNLEWWQASWYCKLNGLDCEICFLNETSVVVCMGGRYNKSAITRFGTYEKRGNTIIATFPGGEGNMTFYLSGRQLIWTFPNGSSKTLVLYDER